MKFEKEIRSKIRDLYAARHEPESLRRLAAAYWAFLVSLLVCITVAGAAYGAWEFFTPPPVNESGVIVKPQEPMSKEKLQKIIEGFQNRAAKFEEAKQAPPTIKDPS